MFTASRPRIDRTIILATGLNEMDPSVTLRPGVVAYIVKPFGCSEIGTAIQVDRGYVVPQVVDIAAAHPASFEEARLKVASDTKAEKAGVHR